MTPYAPQKYLLPSERGVIEVRRHWAILAKPVSLAILVWAACLGLSFALPYTKWLQTSLWWIAIITLLVLGWYVAEWYVERLVITNKRFLLTRGILTRNVAIMPLSKVTDMTYHRSFGGQILGYGEFIVESAGQDQALSRIPFLPKPDDLYRQVLLMLFGDDNDGGD